MPKPDNAEERAKEAYDIWRGMKNPMTDPHWNDLTGEQKGLLEWVVRWARLKDIDR
jgi:hypothetical protein